MTEGKGSASLAEIGDNVIVLDHTLGIADVSTLYETLKCIAATEQDVTIDATHINAIDTSTVQLLVSFVRQIEKSDCKVIWTKEPSEAFLKVVKFLNLESWLDFDFKVAS
jgi:ABC-type transporter Mla MlaB component